MGEIRRCPQCGDPLPDDCKSYCKACQRAAYRKWYWKHKKEKSKREYGKYEKHPGYCVVCGRHSSQINWKEICPVCWAAAARETAGDAWIGENTSSFKVSEMQLIPTFGGFAA